MQISNDDLKKIEEGIQNKYTKVADNPAGLFEYPVGGPGMEAQKYDPNMIDALPPEVIASYCGVGNPFSLGRINKGNVVLDIGCGAGVDTIIAAMMAGATGRAVGIDIVPEMLERAKANMMMMGMQNISFLRASGESLPFEDSEFDVVVSNGAINLMPDKESLLKEVFRVLKPSGRLLIADQIAISGVQKDMKTRLANWFN